MAMESGKIGWAAVGFLLLSAPALAGEAYSFTEERTGGLMDTSAKGRIVVEGQKYRIEYEPSDDPMQPRVVVSQDGGEHAFVLDPERRTYFTADPPAMDQPTSRLFHLVLLGTPRGVKNLRIEPSVSQEPETVSGIKTRRHEIAVTYDITVEISMPPLPNSRIKSRPETVNGKIKLAAVFWVAEDRPRPGLPFFQSAIRTGFPQIDGKLAEFLRTLSGLVVKKEITVSSEGNGGVTPQTEKRSLVLQGPQPVKTQSSQFAVPSGFQYHKPEISRPGFESGPPPG